MGIKLVPIPMDPIGALRGDARGKALLQTLLENRRRDADIE